MLARLLVVTAVVSACTTNAGGTTGDFESSSVEYKDIPLGINAQLDVLFVVDNSTAMAPFRDHLAQSARPLVQALESSWTQPDLHLAVVTGDMADGGLRDNRVLIDEARWNWQRYRNYDGTLPDNFAALFDVGASGADQQGLFATALQGVAADGFLREDAYLAIVFVTAGDDASPLDVEATAGAIKALKADPTKIIVAGALGPESSRVSALLDLFPYRHTRVAISDHDITGVLANVGELFKTPLGAPCVEGRLAEPHQVSAWLENPATGEQADFPECADVGDRGCWSLVLNPVNCVIAPGHWMIDIEERDFAFPAHAIFNLLTELQPAD